MSYNMLKLKVWMSAVFSASLIATALFAAILLYSSSLRPAYIHLLFNLLIVALGAESGILRDLSESTPDTLVVHLPNAFSEVMHEIATVDNSANESTEMGYEKRTHGPAEMITASNILKDIQVDETTLPTSTVDGENATEEEDAKEEEEEITELELYVRAEEFIEKFYKQLRMQREEPYNSLQEFGKVMFTV